MKKRSLFLIVSGVLLITAFLAGAGVASDKGAVDSAYGDWRKAMSSGSAENVVELYSPKAVLLATFDAEPLTGKDRLMAYFKTLTALPKLSVKPQKSLIRIFDDVAINSGTYEFSYEKDGKTVTVPARFSFTYKLDNGKWKIIDHHSSVLPQN